MENPTHSIKKRKNMSQKLDFQGSELESIFFANQDSNDGDGECIDWHDDPIKLAKELRKAAGWLETHVDNRIVVYKD
jgi:hypothetical protein